MQYKKIAVVGSAGFVGEQVARAVQDLGNIDLIQIRRGDAMADLLQPADLVIHAANPARRFRAEQDPAMDFKETVDKTAELLRLAGERRFVLVSSLSCRTQIGTTYGRHRRACELLAAQAGALIVRLGPMFGGSRKRDVLHDILANKSVFVSAETRYAYVDVAWAGKKIVELALGTRQGLIEAGARTAVKLSAIRDRFESTSIFSGPDDTQIPEGDNHGPPAEDVFTYADREFINRQAWM